MTIKIITAFQKRGDIFPSNEFKEFSKKVNLGKEIKNKANKEFKKFKGIDNA